jgi:hypothetical protein
MDLAVNNFVGANTGFQVDVLLLGVGGLVLVLGGLIGFGAEHGARIVSVALGLIMAGYGYYLNFVFTGTTYQMRVYFYILPALVLGNLIRSALEQRRLKAAQAPATPDRSAPTTNDQP